jgi:hypothetical protein
MIDGPEGLEELEDPDEGGTSPPEPTGQGAESPGDDPAVLMEENSQLRQQLRDLQADRLVDSHGLLPSHAELLKRLPRDQQGTAAARFRAELDSLRPKPDPDLDLPPATGGPSLAQVRGDAPGPEPGPTERHGPGQQPSETPPEAGEEEIIERLRAIDPREGWGGLHRIQNEEASEPRAAAEEEPPDLTGGRSWEDLDRAQRSAGGEGLGGLG